MRDAYLVKTDNDGIKLWEKTFGGGGDEEGRSVQQLSDGYIITGFTGSSGAGGWDAYLIKTDATGAVIWEKTFSGALNEAGLFVQQTSDNGYISLSGIHILPALVLLIIIL